MNLVTKTFSLLFFILASVVTSISIAQNGVPKAFNVQGTIFQPASDNPFVGLSNIRFQILDPSGTCVMYQETVTGVDTTNTNGAFSVDLGTTATRINNIDATTTLGLNLFKNNVTYPSITGCTGPVVIGANATRKLRISFDVSGIYSDMTPDIEILTAPYAMIAETLDGYYASEFIKANTSAGLQVSQANLETLLNNLTKFNNLNNFATSGNISGNAATATTASNVSDGSITTAKLAQMGAVPGQVMKWNGTAWAASNDNSGASLGYTPLNPANNLSDLSNAGTALTNLGLGTGQSPSFTGLTLSGITGNTLLRANGSGVLANATSADITGLLGYAPVNPSGSMMSVLGGTASAPGYAFSGDTNTGIFRSTADQIGFATGGTEHMTITSAGKVGIGVSLPSDKLQVNGSIRGPAAVNNGGSTLIDWSAGNTQYSTAGCTGVQYTFSNMRDGGSYTLVVTGTLSSACTFGQTIPDTLSGTPGSGAFYFLPANVVPAGSNAVYSLLRVGNNVYVNWTSGYAN